MTIQALSPIDFVDASIEDASLATINRKGADIASATTTDIGATTGDFVDITGTTTITGLGTTTAGVERTVRFTGVLTLTHNATSLILPSAANITTAADDSAVFRSLGSGNWFCVSYKKASGAAVAGGGGLTNWSESAGTYSSKDWKRFYPASGTNVNAVFSPLGTGSIQAHVADGTATGGNQRGSSSVDWQTKRASASEVASGNYSVISGGRSNTSSGLLSFVGSGKYNTASSGYTAIVGGSSNTASAGWSSALGGRSNTVNGTYSASIGGYRASARSIFGCVVSASGRFGTDGDAQWRKFVLRGSTTNATPKVLTANGSTASSTNQVVLPNNSAYTFRAKVTAHRTDVVSGWTHRASWTVEGAVARDANAASTVATTAAINTITNTPGWTLAVAADTTNGALAFTFTGENGKTIRTVSVVETCEVTS